MCQGWITRNGLFVVCTGRGIVILDSIPVSQKQVSMRIIGMLRPEAIDTLFNLEGPELAIWRIVDAGFLQPKPGCTPAKPALRQCLLVRSLGLRVCTGIEIP